jgi:hypothetical protein
MFRFVKVTSAAPTRRNVHVNPKATDIQVGPKIQKMKDKMVRMSMINIYNNLNVANYTRR